MNAICFAEFEATGSGNSVCFRPIAILDGVDVNEHV